jgi:hypothetical protein
MSCGVETITAPASGTCCAMVNWASPVPGGMSTTRMSSSPHVHLAQHLLQRAHHHRPAPDHRRLLLDQEADRHRLQPPGLQRDHSIAAHLRLARHAQHARQAGAINVGIQQPHPQTLPRQRHRQVHRDRRLAHPPPCRRPRRQCASPASAGPASPPPPAPPPPARPSPARANGHGPDRRPGLRPGPCAPSAPPSRSVPRVGPPAPPRPPGAPAPSPAHGRDRSASWPGPVPRAAPAAPPPPPPNPRPRCPGRSPDRSQIAAPRSTRRRSAGSCA